MMWTRSVRGGELVGFGCWSCSTVKGHGVDAFVHVPDGQGESGAGFGLNLEADFCWCAWMFRL